MTRRFHLRRVAAMLAGVATLTLATAANAEDGYRLWMRYDAAAGAQIEVRGESPTLAIAADELRRGLTSDAGPVVIAPATDAAVAALSLPTAALGPEGYLVRRVTLAGRPVVLVTGNTDVGALYGAFALLRHLGTGGTTADVALSSAPKIKLRVLNHRDCPNG